MQYTYENMCTSCTHIHPNANEDQGLSIKFRVCLPSLLVHMFAGNVLCEPAHGKAHAMHKLNFIQFCCGVSKAVLMLDCSMFSSALFLLGA